MEPQEESIQTTKRNNNHHLKDVILSSLNKNIVLSPVLFTNEQYKKNNTNISEAISKLHSKINLIVLNKDLLLFLEKNSLLNININWVEFEKAFVLFEKKRDEITYTYFLSLLTTLQKESQATPTGVAVQRNEVLLAQATISCCAAPEVLAQADVEPAVQPAERRPTQANQFNDPQENDVKETRQDIEESSKGFSNVIILKNYSEEKKSKQTKETKHFILHLKKRYELISDILKKRTRFQNIISINRAMTKAGEASLIALVFNKTTTKKGNILIELEDFTGTIKAVVNKEKKELFSKTEDIVEDEVIGLKGVIHDKIMFINDIIFPDVPLKEIKKTNEEVYVAFIADLHVGSRMFLHEDFKKFIDWTNCKIGNSEQKQIASKLKYIFIVGDLVDGIGIYPEQDKELTIKDIYKQYEICALLLSKIRKDIQLIICPGNHDAMRISEPQPPLYVEFAKQLYDMPNVTMVSNPSLVNIHSSENFSGFDVLLYHGYSFDYYISCLSNIRNNGGYSRADLVMNLLLKKRHLAPTHASSLYIPNPECDPLVIDKIPDIFLSAHIHKSNISKYNNILNVCCSCWQSKTTFQEKVGHTPDPSKVPVLNLKTQEIKVLKFG